MDQRFLVEHVAVMLREPLAVARQAERDASDEARAVATGSEKRENARDAQQYSSLASGQGQRAEKLPGELNALPTFRSQPLLSRGPIVIGAFVGVENDATGRTYFSAPAGGGLDLSCPGGDSFLSVVGPASPVGRAALGRRVGDTIEITVQGEPRE